MSRPIALLVGGLLLACGTDDPLSSDPCATAILTQVTEDSGTSLPDLDDLAQTAPLDSSITFVIFYTSNATPEDLEILEQEGVTVLRHFAIRPDAVLAGGRISVALRVAELAGVASLRVSHPTLSVDC